MFVDPQTHLKKSFPVPIKKPEQCSVGSKSQLAHVWEIAVQGFQHKQIVITGKTNEGSFCYWLTAQDKQKMILNILKR